MRSTINYEKSIPWKRLIYHPTPSKVFTIIFDYFFGVVLLLIYMAVFFGLASYDGSSILLILLFGTMSGYMICGVFLLSKLVKINGTDPNTNRHRIIDLITAKYPAMKISTGDRLITAKTDHKIIAFDREIFVLVDGSDLYINVHTLLRGNMKSITMALPNYILAQRLAKEFDLMIG